MNMMTRQVEDVQVIKAQVFEMVGENLAYVQVDNITFRIYFYFRPYTQQAVIVNALVEVCHAQTVRVDMTSISNELSHAITEAVTSHYLRVKGGAA